MGIVSFLLDPAVVPKLLDHLGSSQLPVRPRHRAPLLSRRGRGPAAPASGAPAGSAPVLLTTRPRKGRKGQIPDPTAYPALRSTLLRHRSGRIATQSPPNSTCQAHGSLTTEKKSPIPY